MVNRKGYQDVKKTEGVYFAISDAQETPRFGKGCTILSTRKGEVKRDIRDALKTSLF